MQLTESPNPTLVNALWPKNASLIRAISLAICGSVTLWVSAKIQVPFYPVPITMQTFVVLVLGDRWIMATTPLRFLALAATVRSVTPFLTHVLVAKNQPEQSMRFSLIAAFTMTVLFVVGSRWGITGVAVAWLVAG